MDRKFESGAAGAAPTTPNTSTGYATNGNPGGGVPATIPGEWWFHMITEELRKLIADAGLTPSVSDLAQVSAAVQALIGAGIVNQNIVGGRLTLTTALPVTTADVTAAGTLYYTPYVANKVALYDGTKWNVRSFTERSLALTLTSGKNYDVFLYDNAGTPTLELSAAWTNDTTRADALTTQDGVLVKSGATTRRYMGMLRASGSNVTEDSKVKRFLQNYYNGIDKPLQWNEAADSWTYTTATWRQTNNAPANKVEVVQGIAEHPIQLFLGMQGSNSASSQIAVGIGEDSTSSPDDNFMRPGAQANSAYTAIISFGRKVPTAGYHFYAGLEWSVAANTTTWYGDNGNAAVRGGMSGSWRC